jgi:hypothetical protein
MGLWCRNNIEFLVKVTHGCCHAVRTVVSVLLGRCQWFWIHALRGTLLRPFLLSPSFSLLGSQSHPISHRSSAVLPQYGCIFQEGNRGQGTTPRLPAIYSGIGLGVYQGEAVVFLQMAIGERRWTASKLRFEDLAQLPDSVLSDVFLTSCFLRLHRIRPDLVKTGLQKRDALQLMKSLCPLVDNLDMLQVDGDAVGNPLLEYKTGRGKRCPLRCLVR